MDFSKFRKNIGRWSSKDPGEKVEELQRVWFALQWMSRAVTRLYDCRYIYICISIYIFIHDLLALFCVCTPWVLVFSNIVCVFPSFFLFRLMDSVIAEAVHGGATQNCIVKSITDNGKCKPSWQRNDWTRALYNSSCHYSCHWEKKNDPGKKFLQRKFENLVQKVFWIIFCFHHFFSFL